VAVIALLSDLSIAACLKTSVDSSSFFKFDPTAEWALLFSAVPKRRSVVMLPSILPYKPLVDQVRNEDSSVGVGVISCSAPQQRNE
jgi:hypothetical protein